MPKDNRGNYQCARSIRVHRILSKIIDHYETDIQWWGNDEEEQAYKDVYEVRDYLRLYMSPIMPENSTLN